MWFLSGITDLTVWAVRDDVAKAKHMDKIADNVNKTSLIVFIFLVEPLLNLKDYLHRR